MIGKLSGRIDYKADDHILLDVKGVGYIVYCSDRTLMSLPSVGEAVGLYTDLLVREDLLQLFGFTSLVEKEWHRLLMTVQGVGAKASMAILGALGPDGVSRVKAARGIGPKTAQRVVLDLKDKAPSVMAMSGRGGNLQPVALVADDAVIDVIEPSAPKPKKTASAASNAQAEALSALTNLGYSPSDAASAVATALGDDAALETSGLIRAALRLLAPKD
jgi:Holliday junction DNA helicase RuvA